MSVLNGFIFYKLIDWWKNFQNKVCFSRKMKPRIQIKISNFIACYGHDSLCAFLVNYY